MAFVFKRGMFLPFSISLDLVADNTLGGQMGACRETRVATRITDFIETI
jgi:hypothetical protein